MAKSILVTGAAGFIGSHLAEVAALQGYKVKAVDCFSPHLYPTRIKRENWNELSKLSSIELFELDLCRDDISRLVSDSDIIVNCAAVPGLMPSWELFSAYLDSNVLALSKILEVVETRSEQKIIQLSTSSVYGKYAIGGELNQTSPTSPYGVTKLAAENLIKVVGERKDLDFNILRLFSVYGPRQRPDMAYSIILNRLLTGEIIDIYGDGKASRSNTYVSDVTDGILLACNSAIKSEVYNICGGEEFTLNQVLRLLEDITGKKPNLRFMPIRPGDQSVTNGDFSKASKDFGYYPKVTLEKGLRFQYEWALLHQK